MPARVGRMMQDADRVDQVEGFLGDRQVEQVGLDDRDVGQPVAERGGLLDGGAQVHADDPGAMAADQAGVPAAAAAGVEHEPARQVARRDPGLHPERRLVLLGPHHVIAVPLASEARRVGIARQPGNPPDDRETPRARPADQLPRGVALDSQLSAATRASHQGNQIKIHE